MQRVVRSTLVGLLAIAGLTACGDKVQVTNPPPAAKDSVVHGVTVTPASVTLQFLGTVNLAAAVDAGAGVTVRTVSWSSSDATVAAVDQTGKVTASAAKAGTVTITAAATADPNVRGAAVVTVAPGAGSGAPPQVLITGIQQNPGGNQININNAFGQLDVVLDVQTNGQTLRSVSATMTCPGPTTLTQTQTIAGAVQTDAEAAAIPVILSFNTAAFNPTTGAVTLRNGACTLTASATSGAVGTPQTATTTTQLTLNNADGFVVTNTFAGYANAEGVTTATTASDAGGLPWRGGAVTVTVIPVLYTGRTLASVQMTLPGAAGQPAAITAAPFAATWSATAGNGARTTGQTLVGAGFEVNGTTPLGITPAVVVIDNLGNDLQLGCLNCGLINQTTFRLDNSAPQPPTSFVTPGRQAGWAGATYVFSGVGGTSFTAATGTTNYVSCGDAATPAGATPAAANPPVCAAQVGVSAGGVSGTTGLNGLTNTTAFPLTYYAIAAASYAPASAANGTSTSATSCATTGWTKITTAGDLAETLGNNVYVVRIFEKDALGNARCTDLAAAANTINSGVFANGVFGVDKVPPTAAYVEPAADPTAAPNNGALAIGGAIGNFFVKIGLSDNASGFSGTPLATMVTRLAVNPATGVASNSGGSFNNAFACPSGLDGNGACTTANTAQNLPGWFNAATGASLDGTAASPGCAGCGYYVFSQTPRDLARNASTTVTGTATPTIAASFSAAPGQRQVVIDQQAPTVGGIAVPATLTGGASASFATSAADNLDLISSNYTISYAANPAGNTAPGANLPIRTPTGPTLGVAFDNVLTTASSFSVTTPFFIRSIATTSAGGAPQNNGGGTGQGQPNAIAVRAYDAAVNASAPGTAVIAAANVPQTNSTIYTLAPAGANPAATMISFQVSNAAATLVSNCPAAGCVGNAAPLNATSVTLTATSTGNEGATFQFLNPFTQVQFYYFDTVTNEYILIGSAVAPVVTDNPAVTVRTFTWTLTAPFDPPAALGSGTTLKVIAIGVNSLGDGLSSAVNTNIALTNP